jgi:hypothetical protein
LTTSGPQQRHEGQRQDVGTDVVQCQAPAEVADPLHGAQQVRRARRQRPLGDLQHDPQLPRGALRDRQQVVQRRAVQHLRLDVDEQRQRRQQPVLDRAPEGGDPAGRVELGQPALGPGRCEQRIGTRQRPCGPRANAS